MYYVLQCFGVPDNEFNQFKNEMKERKKVPVSNAVAHIQK